MRWGLVPPWAKTAEDGGPDTKGPLLINARAEKVTTLARVPQLGEEQALPGADGRLVRVAPNGNCIGKKAPKTPFYMYGGDGELLFMAGLWSTWRPKDAAEGRRRRC